MPDRLTVVPPTVAEAGALKVIVFVGVLTVTVTGTELIARSAESAALVALITQLPIEVGAVNTVPLMVQFPDVTAKLTAPAPVPPVELSAAV